jgi:hypothetical protein
VGWLTTPWTDTYTLWSSPLPELIADLELRVQQLEAMRETEKAALLDVFRQIEELKRRLDFHYRKINRLEEADA